MQAGEVTPSPRSVAAPLPSERGPNVATPVLSHEETPGGALLVVLLTRK
jgi:hypothetical protein